MTEQGADHPTERDAAVEDFWNVARFHGKLTHMPSYFGPTVISTVPPPVWSFGQSPEEADAGLEALLDGSATTLATSRAELDAAGVGVPEAGTLGIVLDGSGRPRALVTSARVEVGADQVVEHLRVLHQA